MRQKFEAEDPAEVTGNKQDGKVDRSQGAARAISSFIDPGLDWKDIPWFQSITKSEYHIRTDDCMLRRLQCP